MASNGVGSMEPMKWMSGSWGALIAAKKSDSDMDLVGFDELILSGVMNRVCAWVASVQPSSTWSSSSFQSSSPQSVIMELLFVSPYGMGCVS